jgi:hypothetical protein
VGTSKNHGGGDKGRTISLIGCSEAGSFAPGPDDEEEDELAYKQQFTVVTNLAICHHFLSAAAQFPPTFFALSLQHLSLPIGANLISAFHF